MFFKPEGNQIYAVWFTISNEEAHGSELELEPRKASRYASSEDPFFTTVVKTDNDDSKVYTREMRNAELSLSGVKFSTLREWLLEGNKDILVEVSESEAYDAIPTLELSIWSKLKDGLKGTLLVRVKLNDHDRGGGVQHLLENIGMDMRAMMKERDDQLKLTEKRESNYRDYTRKMNDRNEKESSRLNDLFAGFATIFNDKNRQIAAMTSTLDDLKSQVSKRRQTGSSFMQDELEEKDETKPTNTKKRGRPATPAKPKNGGTKAHKVSSSNNDTSAPNPTPSLSQNDTSKRVGLLDSDSD